MDIGKLEGLDQTQDLINGAAHGVVVDGDVAQSALAVDNVQPTDKGGRKGEGEREGGKIENERDKI